MKNFIFVLVTLILVSCGLNRTTSKQKHRNYVRNFHNRHENLPFEPMSLKVKEYRADDLQKDLVEFLDGMNEDELKAFKKDFIYTKPQLSNRDSLLKK